MTATVEPINSKRGSRRRKQFPTVLKAEFGNLVQDILRRVQVGHKSLLLISAVDIKGIGLGATDFSKSIKNSRIFSPPDDSPIKLPQFLSVFANQVSTAITRRRSGMLSMLSRFRSHAETSLMPLRFSLPANIIPVKLAQSDRWDW